MRILFLNPVAQLGGAERMLLDMIASIRAQFGLEHEIQVMLLDDGPLVAAAKKAGADWVHAHPMPATVARIGESSDVGVVAGAIELTMRGLVVSPTFVAFLRQLRTVISSIDPDVVHSNGMKTHVLSRLIVPRHARTRIVWHIHDLLGQRPLMGRLLRRFAGRTSAAIAISQAVARDTRLVLPDTPVHTVLNAIDVEHYSPDPSGNRSAGAWLDMLAGLARADDASVVRVGLVATYARWKGQDLFLDAAARALLAHGDRFPRLQFYVVGGPIYATAGSQSSREQLRHRATELGLAAQVGFVDFQDDPRDVYRALDVVVHASTKPEPFGRTIAEAMSCGRAVIVSNAGGAAELFSDGQDALGFAPGSADELAGAIARLVRDADLRTRLGTAGRATACREFDRSRLATSVTSVYRSVVK